MLISILLVEAIVYFEELLLRVQRVSSKLGVTKKWIILWGAVCEEKVVCITIVGLTCHDVSYI